ncbi:MAG: 2-keto-4-pentenoate hydratase [Acidimicrobiales bacterium]
MTHDQFAAELHQARLDRRVVAPITERRPGFGIDDAYAVQAGVIQCRVADGETIIGGKLGFTSRAMQEAMGVDDPNYGWLTDAMVIHGGRVPLDQLIHPKVEPEIAFLLRLRLNPPASAADVLDATAAVMPCLEVVDSRYVDFRFAAPDNIADNSSAAMVALGDPHPIDGLDLALVGVVLSVDGRPRFTAAGAAALDHPAAAVAWMVNHCDRPLPAGHIVLSGGLTPPVDLGAGTVVTAEFDRLGSITLSGGADRRSRGPSGPVAEGDRERETHALLSAAPPPTWSNRDLSAHVSNGN